MQENTESTDGLRNSESVIMQVPSFETELVGFTNVIQSISTLVEEATIELTSEGLTFRAMDPSHVALLDISLPKMTFVEWNIVNAIKVGVRVDELVKILKSFDKRDNVKFEIQEQYLHIKQGSRKASVRLIETTGGNTPLPKLNFNADVFIDKEGMKRVIRFLDVTEYVKFSVQREGRAFNFTSKDDYSENSDALQFDNAEGLAELVVKEDSTATYSSDYIKKILKVLNMVHKEVKIQYSTKMPLRLEARPFNYGVLHFYLAPRVQD